MYFYTSINIHGPHMWSYPQQNSDYYYMCSGFITGLKTPVVELQQSCDVGSNIHVA